MRVVFVGVSHWHTPLYLEPARETAAIEIVGVSDPDAARAQPVAERAGCSAWTDHREMFARTRPDFAFILGRHDTMAGLARDAIAAKLPFAIEKPAGIDAAETALLADQVRAAGLHASVAFVMRHSPVVAAIREIAAGEAVQYLAFKFVAGMVGRYRDNGVDWMLRRASSGGGCLLNLGVHFLDLCRVLSGAEPAVVGALMLNANAGLEIEDHALVTLRAGNASCLVETGYLYPAPGGVFDMHFSIRTERHYFAARDAETLEISDDAQRRETRAMPTTNMGCYPIYVCDVVARLRDGRPPIATLDDMAATMRLVEAAYAASPPLIAAR